MTVIVGVLSVATVRVAVIGITTKMTATKHVITVVAMEVSLVIVRKSVHAHNAQRVVGITGLA
jgi:hypothetical protein